jgi:1,2-phenylacetyl-CoA epoxidase catalytic subunit
VNERELLGLADDELILGWRDSEWTGIAPMLEEDVAFSSIAQNEIGHARAVYELLSEDADALAFDSALKESLPLAAKIDREETYHRMHAEMWHERLRDTSQFRDAVEELWPYALGMLPPSQRDALSARVGLPMVEAVERGTHTDQLAEIWNEMTIVRRSVPAGAQW